MLLTFLTDSYKTFLEDHDQERYFVSHPTLFDHYFSFWADQSFFRKTLNANEVEQRLKLLKNEIPFIERVFEKEGLSLDACELVFFVGQNTSNGHAFCEGSKSVVWVPIESYQTQSQVRVFLTHEIIHALHYAAEPAFSFSTVFEKNQVGRQIITEGIATYVTKSLLHIDYATALWADYLSHEKQQAWLQRCEKLQIELFQYVQKKWDESGKETQLFFANDPQDVFAYRAGYYAGLKLVERIMQTERLSIQKSLCLLRDEWENRVQSLLRVIIGNQSHI